MDHQTLTISIALWGAVSGTTALVWDIVKWSRDRPNLKASATPGMKILENGTIASKTLLQLRIVNAGTRQTKITALGVWVFSSRLNWIRKKPASTFVIPTPELSSPIPAVLAPGEDWFGRIDQEELLRLVGDDLFCCAVEHTLGRKPVGRVLDARKIHVRRKQSDIDQDREPK